MTAKVNGVTYEYATTQSGTIPSAGNTIDLPVQATQLGKASNLSANTVTTVKDLPSADTSLTCTNPERMAGGRDAAKDEEFRATITNYNLTLRKGTVAAVEAGAQQVDGVVFATVDESTVASNGYVSVYIGDPDGAGNTALASAVTTELDNWRCAGVQVQVFAAAREEITMVVDITYQAGADTSAIEAGARDAIVAHLDAFAANEHIYPSKVEALVHAVDTLNVLGVVVTPSQTAPTQTYNALRVVSADLTINFTAV